MQFTCATYNILHGYHRELILGNIRFLIDQGADVICLQEAEEKFEPSLRALLRGRMYSHWDVRFAHAGIGGNVATLWNRNRLTLSKDKIVELPTLKAQLSLRRFRGLAKKIKRVALITGF
jgi:endonuclease/exonuclease/phosphatase family metal-dependent hydrolase